MVTALFDNALKTKHRSRAKKHQPDFLRQEIAIRIAERLEDIAYPFPHHLDLGGYGEIGKALNGKHGITTHTHLPDAFTASEFLEIEPSASEASSHLSLRSGDVIKTKSNLITSNLWLHWVNDLPGALLQIRSLLGEKGLFLATLLGGNSLVELRQSLMEAEMHISGGVSPRMSPSIHVKDAGALVQRAGFALPVGDSEIITVEYQNLLPLLHDLRLMGETNALLGRSKNIPPRTLFLEAERIYRERFATTEGTLPATFEIITLTGWGS